ncbi:MAG: hypothetical protein SGPRY_005630 [Prymnesium sp.]
MALHKERHGLEYDLAEGLVVINQGKFLRECLEGESVAQPAALKLRELYSAAMETERKRRGSVRGMQSPAAGKTAVLSVGDSAASEASTLQARPSPALRSSQLYSSELRGQEDLASVLCGECSASDELWGVIEMLQARWSELALQSSQKRVEARQLVATDAANAIRAGRYALVTNPPNQTIQRLLEREERDGDSRRVLLSELEEKEASLLRDIELCGRAHGTLRLLDALDSRVNEDKDEMRWRYLIHFRVMISEQELL